MIINFTLKTMKDVKITIRALRALKEGFSMDKIGGKRIDDFIKELQTITEDDLPFVLGMTEDDFPFMTDENHLDDELNYRKEKGRVRVYCMYRDLLGDDEWVNIKKWDKDHILIKSKGAIVVPIKPFIELLQEFAKEIEVEKR